MVLRVLSREEIVRLAERTREIRAAKEDLQRFAREVVKGQQEGEQAIFQEGGEREGE